MINNNSGNKNKNVTFYRSMYIFLILIQVNVYFLILIQVNVYFFNPVLEKYTLTCINDKKVNKKYTLTCIILFFSSIVCEVNKTVFFFI